MSGPTEATAARATRPERVPAPDALHVPSPTDLTLILVALLAVSTSGPLIAATAAPTLAIAFWRNAMASGVLVPFALVRNRAELAGLDRRERRLALTAGLLLAVHFSTWVPSLDFTSVASATALVGTQPVWSAVIARRQGHVIPRRAWLGIVVAVIGAALLTGVDFSVSRRALAGDALALVGGFFAAAYMAAGGEVRRSVSTTAYTTVCYLTASLALLVACLAGGQALGGYSARAWIYLAALTAGAQLLGHSVFNRVLRTTSATVVSLSILLEMPGAALIAFVWLHQRPHAWALPGLAVLLAGIGLVVTSRQRRDGREPAVPVE